jgi:hypothetical protein
VIFIVSTDEAESDVINGLYLGKLIVVKVVGQVLPLYAVESSKV